MMQTQTEQLARAIYRTAAENMHAAGRTMPCTGDVFAVLTNAHPCFADYGALRGLTNSEFVQAAFVLLLQRPLDEKTAAYWQRQAFRSPRAFQTAVLRAVLSSAEYRQRGIPLLHCELPVSASPQPDSMEISLPFSAVLRRMYRRMPAPVRGLIRRAAGR